MKSRFLAISTVVLALAFFLLPAAAQPAGAPVTIRGRITNGTSGAEVPQGLEVTIVALNESGEELGRTVTKSTAGSFSGEAPAGERHVALTTHLGVTYSVVVEYPAQLA